MTPVDINFESFDKKENVLVLGAGPSFSTNKEMVNNIIKECDPLIIGSNYNYSLIKESDYTVFIGKGTFRHRYKDTKSDNIIVTSYVYRRKSKSILSDETHKYFILSTCATQKDYWNKSVITFKEDKFDHWLSNCGYTALLSSVFFKPKCVTLVGFDGPTKDGSKVKHFNGDIRNNKDIHRKLDIIQRKGNFLTLIFEFLKKNGVSEIRTFSNEKLWGANRSICLNIN